MATATAPKKYLTKQTIALFWGHARRYPRFLWPLLVITPVTIVLGNFVTPFVISQILQHLSQGTYDHTNLWGSFAPYLITYMVAVVLDGIIGWRVIMWLIWNLEINVVRDLNHRVFDHLMRMSSSFHANRFGGSLVSQTNKLAGAYIRLADSTIFNLMSLIVSLVATVIILAPRVPLFVVILVVISIAFIIGTTYFSRDVRQANIDEAAMQSRQTGYLADSIANIFAIKTFSAGDYERRRFAGVSNDVYAAGRRSLLATIKRQNYSAILTQMIGIASLTIAVLSVGATHADIATVFLMVTYSSVIARNLWEFQNVLRQYNRAFGDASDMVEILQIEAEIKDPPRPKPMRARHGQISFENVSFTHDENESALFHDFNLTIKAGEKIGLVGHSGSGKTTLTRLLLRFSDLDAGRIAIDGQDITEVTQDDLRRVISYVPQEPLLFHRSLQENISYGKPKAPKSEVLEAARQAHAAEFIERLPEGYDTMVGERGVKLSGGQRQRIAIARAMLKDAPILVLDEATSALDSESEKLIQDALWKLMEGRTAIVIAHRLSTIQRMDRIVVLDNGQVAEVGSHAELLKNDGIYARLWSHQSGGFIDED